MSVEATFFRFSRLQESPVKVELIRSVKNGGVEGMLGWDLGFGVRGEFKGDEAWFGENTESLRVGSGWVMGEIGSGFGGGRFNIWSSSEIGEKTDSDCSLSDGSPSIFSLGYFGDQ